MTISAIRGPVNSHPVPFTYFPIKTRAKFFAITKDEFEILIEISEGSFVDLEKEICTGPESFCAKSDGDKLRDEIKIWG